MKPTDPVNNLINCLTNDEDKRQELWLYYLSGNSVEDLVSRLDQINSEYEFSDILQENIWKVIKNPPSDKFYQLLTHFSEVEKSVVALLALGLSISQVSKYKGISEIRIRQVIAIIRENDCWEELYGIKEKIDTR